MTNTKQTQDDRTIQPFNRSTIQHIKAYAFTLAETLIVIGIIGVVAALTLPNLNHATGDKERVTRVKKIFSSLTDAYDRARVVYGEINEWEKGIDEEDYGAMSERFAKRIAEFLKVSKYCGFDEGCFSSGPITRYDGRTDEDSHLSFLQRRHMYMFMLSDGTSVAVSGDGTNGTRVLFEVDIDGPNKGKNKYGYDVFKFDTYNVGNDANFDLNCYGWTNDLQYLGKVFGSGYSASCWILTFDNADYLNIDSTGKCNNSDIILDGLTNTSCH